MSAIQALLGQASIGSSARDAQLSQQRVKEVSRQTIRNVLATTRVSRDAVGVLVSVWREQATAKKSSMRP